VTDAGARITGRFPLRRLRRLGLRHTAVASLGSVGNRITLSDISNHYPTAW
jgi:hypothetical protein